MDARRRSDVSALKDLQPVEHILELARHHVGMDLAFLGEFVQDEEVFRYVSGDQRSIPVHAGMAVRLHETYCDRMTDRRLSCIVQDAKQEERVNCLEVRPGPLRQAECRTS